MKGKFTFSVLVLSAIASFSNAQAPATYYNAATGKTCSDLKTSLKNIISTGTTKAYDNLWNQYKLTDTKPREIGTGSATVIYDIYSDKPGPNNDPYNFTPGSGTGGQEDHGGGGTAEGQYYNREHSVPQSWFSGNTGTPGPTTDYNFIFPTDKKINGIRSNFPYGEVASATFTSLNGSKLGQSGVAGVSGTVFEPIDSFKGDVARAFLYFVTRYESNMSTYAGNSDAKQAFEPNTYPSVDIPFLRMMINWHHLDPVSQKEITRNNGTYSYQGNRNPYIDHPEYVDLVWNIGCNGLSTLPVDIVSFGGRLVNGFVQLEWTVKNELNFTNYQIERSFNGTSFSALGQVQATNLSTYHFSDNADENRGRQVFYRLKKIDKDGHFSYSPVFTIHLPFNTRFSVYPNPAKNFMQLQLNKSVTGKAVVQLMDLSGKVILQQNIVANGNNFQLPVSSVNPGSYLVKLIFEGEQYLQKVIIVK